MLLLILFNEDFMTRFAQSLLFIEIVEAARFNATFSPAKFLQQYQMLFSVDTLLSFVVLPFLGFVLRCPLVQCGSS